MSGIAAGGAVLAVLILTIAPNVLELPLPGDVYFLWVLVSLFIGVIVFKILNE